MEKTDKFKILCIDGGGIKGLYTATLLAKLEETFSVKITDCFDLICGTSTGGLIALAASLGKPMSEVVEFYKKYGAEIFDQKTKKHLWGKNKLSIKQAAFKGKYNGNALENALTEVFGTKKIGESKNFLCIPSYSVITGSLRVFKKDYGDLNEDDKLSYVDVALATSAAPTYFPVKHLGHDYFIDGGVWANNPIMVGLTEYLYNFSTLKQFKGVDILSIESCEILKNEAPRKLKRSFWNWKDSLFDAYSHGQSASALFLLEKLRGHLNFDMDFYRLSKSSAITGEQEKCITMDDASPRSMELLQSLAVNTAINEKMKPQIRHYFSTVKSLNPSEYGK